MQENRFIKKYTEGLTSEEVAIQIAAHKQNIALNTVSKSTKDILKDNICTLFNLLNVVIAIALAIVQAYTNMFFILIIILNVVIGIFQELHARNLVEKLSLLSATKALVIRNHKQVEIAVEELVVDDIVLLRMGNQISADSIIVEGELEVNESLLTGEADLIVKKVGDSLYSGSFVASGHAHVRVEAVGVNSFSNKIIREVKKHKAIKSELLDALRLVTKFTTCVIIPFGIILFLQAFYGRNDTTTIAIIATSAALLGMLPKGLVLLISLTSATGVIKLAKKEVLVQEMHCMETLAHVDVLCLDKTGTITEGNMKVIEVHPFKETIHGIAIDVLLSTYVHHAKESNATFRSLQAYFTNAMELEVVKQLSFSSDRKWGAMQFKKVGTLVVGAPERIIDTDQLPSVVKQAQLDGKRVLMLAHSMEWQDVHVLPKGLTCVAIIALDDPIRENANQTLAYFREEGVEVKVISGDNALTVSNIARKAGLQGYENYIDMSLVKDAEITSLALTHSVFGRVSPQQKRSLILALKKAGHCVAMSGDGVNDVLALREADCGIAMAEGNEAAKQISQLVLLNSDFASLPEILGEGRRVVNNVTKVASIFFIKTIYSVLLSILCMFTTSAFPFIPIQITLIDLAIEGYPSFFLSFEADNRKLKGTFLKTSLISALPHALLIIANILVLQYLQPILQASSDQLVTMMYLLVGFSSILAVLKACLPFNPLRIFLFMSVGLGFYTAVYIGREILHIRDITVLQLQAVGVLAIVSFVCLVFVHGILKKISRA
ncbi:MAG: HAD-IC family P-type ATPase [Breznakia sp.]